MILMYGSKAGRRIARQAFASRQLPLIRTPLSLSANTPEASRLASS